MPVSVAVAGTAWRQWQDSAAGRHFDRGLAGGLSKVIADWQRRGAALDSFRVLRSSGGADFNARCGPFEKSHARGEAIDLRVGDGNRDERSDVIDACLFAVALQNERGAVGIYGVQSGKGSEVWLHIGSQARRDCWGEVRRINGDGTVEVQPIVWSKQSRSLRQRAADWGLAFHRHSLRVVIDKRPALWRFDARTQALTLHPSLTVYHGQRPLKYFAAALGFDATGDKAKRDDYRTPEGDFYVCDFNAHSRFHKSLRLSYPNAEDAARGLRDGLIDRATQQAIVRAMRRGQIPPQDTKLGGDIMIHGGGVGHNWTWGCIALEDAAIDELFATLPPHTPIKVLSARR